MLDRLFMQVLDMSRAAAIVILCVLAARLLLRRAPKAFSYALWAVVLFRLLCPVTPETKVAVVPELRSTAAQYTLADQPISFAGATQAAAEAAYSAVTGGSGTAAAPESAPRPVQQIETERRDEQGTAATVTADRWEVWILFGKYVWCAGVILMALGSGISFLRLKRRLREAVPLRDNIYLADSIGSPFVLGLLRPKIYLPSTLSLREQGYIIRHEQVHIRRLDPLWKALGFLALCLHWFNPLVWLAFILAGRDMEMSCDEAVMRTLESDIRADYSASLLSLATGRRIIAGTPLAFGEGDPRCRIRNILRWRQPKRWISVLAALLAVSVTAACAGNVPGSQKGEYRDIDEFLSQQDVEKRSDAKQLRLERTDGGTAVLQVKGWQLDTHKLAEVTDLTEDGTLEYWYFQWLTQVELDGLTQDDLMTTLYNSDCMALDWESCHNFVALRYDDGSVDILLEGELPEEFMTYRHNGAEALHDWYVVENRLDLPLYVTDWAAHLTDADESVTADGFPVHRYDGEGWYLYLPARGWAMAPAAENRWRWYCGADSACSLTLEKLTTPVEPDQTGAESSADGAQSRVSFVSAPDGGSFRITAQWPEGDALSADLRHMPQLLQLMADSFTLDERIQTGGGLLARLAALRGEDIAFVSWDEERGGNPTLDELADMIRHAVMEGMLPDGESLTVNGSLSDVVWSLDVYLGDAEATEWSGDDVLYLWAGQTENVVQIFGGSNLPREMVLVKDEALYQLIRTGLDTEPAPIDQAAYRKWQSIVDAWLAERSFDGDGVSVKRELTGFYLTREELALGAEFYLIESVGVVTPAEKAPSLLAGGAYVDSDLCIHYDGSENNILVLIDGEAAGFTSWMWLDIDRGLDRCATRDDLRRCLTTEGLAGSAADVGIESADPSVDFTGRALTVEVDALDYDARLAQVKAESLGGQYWEGEGCLAWVTELTGTPHAQQYRLDIRFADGTLAQLPLPWADYPAVALPESTDYPGGFFCYDLRFDDTTYFNDGNSINHVAGTYYYAVDLAAKTVSLTVIR